MSAERLHHTQQFSSGHNIEGMGTERPLHHTTTGHMLGNIALGEFTLPQQHRPYRSISREEVLLEEAKAAKFESDRTHFVDEAYKEQSTLETTINAAPEEPAINFEVYIEKSTGHTAQTDY